MSHSRILASVLAGVMIAPAIHAQVEFQTATHFAAGDGTQTLELSALAAGDFDGLNGPDLIVTSTNIDLTGNPVMILSNDGAGSFARGTTLDVRDRPSSVVVADLNGDGNLDLAIALLADDQVAVLLGSALGRFGNAVRYDVGDSPVHVAAGDIDGRNGLDLITANEEDDTVSVLLNNGGGTFANAVATDVTAATGPSRSEPNGTASGDFDGDGNGDLAVALAVRDELGILLGNGDGTFDAMDLVAVGRDPHKVLAQDLNGDDDLDLVVANTTDDSVSVLLGDGAGAFTVDDTYNVGNNPQGLALADLDKDGNLDLVTANREGDSVSVLLGNGDGTFGTPSNFDVGGGPVGVVVADFNRDGDPDIATVNQESSLTTRDDVSVLLAGLGISPDADGLIPCGAGCGPLGLMPMTLTLLGLIGVRRYARHLGLR